jgi:hypothetical protein
VAAEKSEATNSVKLKLVKWKKKQTKQTKQTNKTNKQHHRKELTRDICAYIQTKRNKQPKQATSHAKWLQQMH